MYPYAYTVWALASLVVWLGIYRALPRVRREMLILSLIVAPIGILGGYFHSLDYFLPQRLFGTLWSIEDVIIGFTYGGIAGALYEFLGYDRKERPQRPGYWTYGLFVIALASLWMWFAGTIGLNSAYAFIGTAFGLGLFMCVLRPRLWRHALFTGSAFCVAHTLFYVAFFSVFPNAIFWWHLEQVSGVLLWGIPLEEFLWVFSWGFAIGPASELCTRLPLPSWIRLEKLGVPRYSR